MAAAMAEEASRWTVERTDSTPQSVSDDTPLHQSLRAYAPGARVLVADDNADMRDYLARLLGEHWEVLVARDGREALEVARAQRPDLVVADVMMPELDGFGLVAQLREDPALAAIPTVLVTARAGEEAAIEGLLAGADDYIVKPFSARELLARVGGQLELARARRRTAELNAFLVRFSDAVRGLDDPAEVARTACRMILGQLGGIRSYWSEIDFEAGEWVTVGEAAAPGAQAITGRYPLEAWQSGTTQLLLEGGASVKDDIQADAGLPVSVKELCAGLDMAANLALPVQVDGRTRCVLAVDDREPRRWSADEVALVQAVAVRCWGEVERARAEAALRASEQRHAFLLKLSDTLRSLTDAAEIKHTAAALLGERLRVDRAFWSEMVGDDWVIDDVFETNGAPLPPGRYPAGVYGRWTMDTLRAGLPVAIGDTAGDARLHPSERAALQGIGVVAVIGVPLLREGEVVATLSVHSHEPRAWTDEELELVQETADRTWPAVERTRAEASLRYQLAVANTPGVGVLTWETATGTLLDANEVFFQLSGYERELMAAGEITWRLLTADEDVAESERQLDRLARTGHIGPYRKDLVRADGSRVPMLYAGAAIGEGIAVEYCIDVRHGGLADALLVDLAREPR
jgi:CheY-like chemotaxis protein